MHGRRCRGRHQGDHGNPRASEDPSKLRYVVPLAGEVKAEVGRTNRYGQGIKHYRIKYFTCIGISIPNYFHDFSAIRSCRHAEDYLRVVEKKLQNVRVRAFILFSRAVRSVHRNG